MFMCVLIIMIADAIVTFFLFMSAVRTTYYMNTVHAVYGDVKHVRERERKYGERQRGVVAKGNNASATNNKRLSDITIIYR